MDLAEREQNAPRRELLPLLLGPAKHPQRDPGELRYPVVFSFHDLVHGITKSVDAGELPAAVNGAAAPEAFLAAGPPPLTPLECCEPSIFRSTPRIRRYPFGVNLPKETLELLSINPQSLSVLRKIRFPFFESVDLLV